MRTLQGLIHPPRLWPTESHSERRVTWMELFFDLIFVAAVAQLGKPLAEEYTWQGLLRYAFLFILIWLAWTGHTTFATRFDTDDLIQRAFNLLQSFIAAVMAANSRQPLDSVDAAGFGAAYAGIRIVLVLQYLRARRVHATRYLTTRLAIGYSVAAAVWIASALAPIPFRYWLWAAALTIDLAVPSLARGHTTKFPPDAAHFPERFGLFTIILLGEFVAAVMHGIESQPEWSFSAASTAFLSMTFAFAVWWWYFDGAKAAAERPVRTRKQLVCFRIWNYAHLPLFLGIGVAGVGFELAIALKPDELLNASHTAILCLSVGTLMAGLIAIGASSDHSGKRILAQCAALAVAILLMVFEMNIHRVALTLALVTACVAQTILSQRVQETR